MKIIEVNVMRPEFREVRSWYNVPGRTIRGASLPATTFKSRPISHDNTSDYYTKS